MGVGKVLFGLDGFNRTVVTALVVTARRADLVRQARLPALLAFHGACHGRQLLVGAAASAPRRAVSPPWNRHGTSSKMGKGRVLSHEPLRGCAGKIQRRQPQERSPRACGPPPSSPGLDPKHPTTIPQPTANQATAILQPLRQRSHRRQADAYDTMTCPTPGMGILCAGAEAREGRGKGEPRIDTHAHGWNRGGAPARTRNAVQPAPPNFPRRRNSNVAVRASACVVSALCPSCQTR